MAMLAGEPTYYDLLHASQDAPQEIIRGCYRTLMQQLKRHPDLGGDTLTAARINEAYAVLGNVERRAEYDAQLAIVAQLAAGASDIPPTPSAKPDRVPDPGRECMFCEMPHDHGRIVETDACCNTCGSPLFAAENRRIERAGQRAIARIDKKQEVTFYTHWPQSNGFVGCTEDISLNGLRFVTNQELRAGQRIKIVSDFLEAVATVTHCVQNRQGHEIGWVAGVSFATLRFVRSVGGFVSDHV